MDELLCDHAQRLKEIDDRLERIERMTDGSGYANVQPINTAVVGLRIDLARWVADAEQAYADF